MSPLKWIFGAVVLALMFAWCLLEVCVRTLLGQSAESQLREIQPEECE